MSTLWIGLRRNGAIEHCLNITEPTTSFNASKQYDPTRMLTKGSVCRIYRRTKGEYSLLPYALRYRTSHRDRACTPGPLSSGTDALPRVIREVAATGVSAIDVLLGGGLPVGAISELTGPQSSGRTSLALAFLHSEPRRNKYAPGWIQRTPSIRSRPQQME